ncbi:hypothetical protein LZ32DRAFT_459630 [Colletotrichum eremochloae]|nr:hypothetical protein LZ32DRAFT_459630 [Colletotrichum eremochloae]
MRALPVLFAAGSFYPPFSPFSMGFYFFIIFFSLPSPLLASHYTFGLVACGWGIQMQPKAETYGSGFCSERTIRGPDGPAARALPAPVRARQWESSRDAMTCLAAMLCTKP